MASSVKLDDLVTSAQLQARFGVCRKTVGRWVKRGLKVTIVGKLYVFRQSDVAEWLLKHGKPGPTATGSRFPAPATDMRTAA